MAGLPFLFAVFRIISGHLPLLNARSYSGCKRQRYPGPPRPVSAVHEALSAFRRVSKIAEILIGRVPAPLKVGTRDDLAARYPDANPRGDRPVAGAVDAHGTVSDAACGRRLAVRSRRLSGGRIMKRRFAEGTDVLCHAHAELEDM